MILAVLQVFFIVNADIFYNLTLWKFYIYDHIIHVIKKLLFCILSLLKENANSVNQAKDHLHHQNPCTMLYFYKNNLVLTVTEYTCTWVFFKTMGPPEGSSKPREHPRVLFNDVRRNRVSTNKLILHSFFHLYIIFFVEFHVKFLFHLLLNIL